ncbi:MAG TPA: 5'/3'-nucleotidase SurE [Pyrinomonadaceae bacterium]|jgi:5'-nucleotidase
MTRILLTNDDGIHSDGLIKLEEALQAVGDVYTVAPASEMSGASHSLTLSRPLRIRHIDRRHWTVDGTPTDCVTLALHKILPREEWPHICVSGINHGGNLGDDASYSGTVAGALEATILSVTGLAFSLVARENYDFTHAAAFAAQIVRKVLAEGLPEGILLNINMPPGELRRGVSVTRQGMKNARPIITEKIDPRGKAYYWIGEEVFPEDTVEGTDYYAIKQGKVSVTPMRSDMTDHRSLVELQDWNSASPDELVPATDQTVEHV